MKLSEHKKLYVKQQFETLEFFGFETRNKYQISDENGLSIAFAAEQRKGIFGFFLRQYLGHWFKFDVHFYDEIKLVQLIAHHPFRWYFTRLELIDSKRKLQGAIQKRFSFFSKKFDIEDENGIVRMSVSSPIWKFWTFIFERNGMEMAAVRKKWSGGLSEVFTDRDNFLIEFTDPALTERDRQLILVSAIFIDLMYFERKAGN